MQMDDVFSAIKALMPKLGSEERSVALEVYRDLAERGTISVGSLCARTGLDASRIEALLVHWPGVYRDEQRDIVGFWGLTAKPVSKHRLRIQGQERYAWCAWDCLFIPALLDQTVQVASVCPQTGELIELTVSPGAVKWLRPDTTVLSILVPDPETAQKDVISAFCHFVYFFKDREAARTWTAVHPGTQPITIDQGFELGRLKNEWQFGSTAYSADARVK